MPHARPWSRATSRGFTLIEAGALSALLAVGAAVTTASQPLSRARSAARQVKDATQVRVISQALMVFAQNNRDLYPIPGLIDRDHATIKSEPEAKNTTANVFSLLIWMGMISPEIAVSPAETSPNIKPCSTYVLSNPTTAAKPAEALWDPAFNADFTGGKTGQVSYAHQMLFGERLARWSNTFSAVEPMICTRGPEITGVRVEGDVAFPTFANPQSRTFSFFQPEGAWSGNVSFNDSHVEFIASHFAPGRPVETAATYRGAGGVKKPDMAFYDEPDDAGSVNNFLSIFVTAGAKRSDFKAIWD